jgi:hypothetical protein
MLFPTLGRGDWVLDGPSSGYLGERSVEETPMCRSIKTLRGMEPAPTDDEVRAAALQFVRKISGYRKPSAANTAIFDATVEEIMLASRRLLDGLETRPRAA